MFLSDTSIKRPVFTTMVMLGLAVFGFISLRSLGIDLFPRIEFPVVTVISVLPGADPHTVETTVSKPIEEALSTISSIKHLRSASADSVSQVVVEFELEKNSDAGFQDVQAKLSSIRSELPSDLEDPVIEKLDIDSSPIMALVVAGDQPIQQLSDIADRTVKTRLQRVAGVGQVKLIGNRDRNIWIYLDPCRLEGLNLSVQEVAAALKNHHIELPGGRIETGEKELLVRTKAEFNEVSQFNDLVVAYRNDAPIRLADVGEVVDGLEEQRSLARLDDKKAVALLIRRQSGENTVAVAEAIKKEISALKSELAPYHVSLEIAQDLSVFIHNSIHEIQLHLVFGGLLAIIVVFFFLRNARSALISALAIPLSVLSTFMVMSMANLTMNSITMLALSLAIGILIDDAIVVVENIFRHFRKGGDAKKAASDGTEEIGLAAIAITMSIVAVFLPVAFMKGMIGRFLYQFGVTMTAAVLVSLFVAFTLTPMLASILLKSEPPKRSFLAGLDRWYGALLGRALSHKALTLLIAAGALAAAFCLLPFIRSEFLPFEDQSDFNIKVKTPLGTSLTATDAVLEHIREQICGEPWMKYAFTTIGTDNLRKVNEGMIYVKMTPKAERSLSQQKAMDQVRMKVGSSSEYTASIEQVPRVAFGGRRNCSLQVDIKGSDLSKLQALSTELITRLKKKPGYADMDMSYDARKPELDIAIRRDRAAALGVTPAAIAQTVYTMVGGHDVVKYTVDGERYDISVRLPESFRTNPENLFQMTVRNASGDLISLGNVIEITNAMGPVQIDRDNKERLISIYVNLVPGQKALGQGVSEITALLKEMGLPPGYSFQFTGMADIMKESFANLLFALELAVLVVYMVLASQFESFVQPLVIMLSLPFSMIGALGALLLVQATLNIHTIIALILLLGLVTKNAILLVDYTNTLRTRDGLDVDEALKKAGQTRLHPILMTTLAMIFGMLPIALSHAEGSESHSPMAIATIGGLATSTLLTLVVVPVVYALVEKARNLKKTAAKESVTP